MATQFHVLVAGDNNRAEIGLEYNDVSLKVLSLSIRSHNKNGRSNKRMNYTIERLVGGVPVTLKAAADVDISKDSKQLTLASANLKVRRDVELNSGIWEPLELGHIRVEFI